MPVYRHALIASFGLYFACLQANATDHPDWTTGLDPFQIADNLYYVGSRDLAAYLIKTSAGNILINANLESSPPLIRASIEKLGFSWKDTKILLNSQAHSDHMGGAAQVLKETQARDMVMEGDADVVRSGGRKDFAFGTDGMQTEGEAVFIDPNGYVDTIKEAKADFEKTVATQAPKSSQAKPLQ